jgi:hypothetical protein
MSEATSSPDPVPTPNRKRHWRLAGVLICLLLAVSLVLLFLLFRSGIHVTVQNSGSQPLWTVVLHVTGAKYELGDIAPGETASAAVHPTGESHLEIEFTDRDGEIQRLDAGGYFESGYRGTIDISIQDGKIRTNEQEIRLRWSLP